MSNIPVLQNLPFNPPQVPKSFNVPQMMEPHMTLLSGFVMKAAQDKALAGNGDYQTVFWVQCATNNFANPIYAELLQHAAAYAFSALMNNQALLNNPNSWLAESAATVVNSYTILWASNNLPQAFANLNQNDAMAIRSAVAQYTTSIQQCLQLMQNSIGGNAAMMMGMGNNGWGQQQGFGGFNGAQPGMAGGLTPQQMMILAMGNQQMPGFNNNQGWGQNNQGGWFSNNQQQGNGFNASSWGQQLANNQFSGGGNWQYSDGQQNTNLLNATKLGGFESADAAPQTQQSLAEVWGQTNTQQNQNQNQIQNQQQNQQQNNGWGQSNESYTWGTDVNTSGFVEVPTNNQTHLDDMIKSYDVNHAAANAPLQPLGSNDVVNTAPATVNQPAANKQTVINPSNLPVRIELVSGAYQRHLKFFDPAKQYTICTVENGKVVKQEVRNKESENMNFEDQNTAKFLLPKGTTANKVVQDSGLTLSEVATRSLHSAYLESTLEQLAAENTAKTLTSEEISKSLARISEEKIIRLENMVSGSHTAPFDTIDYSIRNRGIDAIFGKMVIVGDIIELDKNNLNDEIANLFDDLREGEFTVSRLVHGFNRIRDYIGEDLWLRLNEQITVWINEELYVNYGVSLAIGDFAGQFEALTQLLLGDNIGLTYEEIQTFVSNIVFKFLNVYRHDHPSAPHIYTAENGYNEDLKSNQLGLIQRYVFLPIYNKDLEITTNSTSGIVTAANQPELYGIISTTLPNLATSQDVIARNFLVTLNGERILVSRPSGMSQYILTRLEGGVIKNPLL